MPAATYTHYDVPHRRPVSRPSRKTLRALLAIPTLMMGWILVAPVQGAPVATRTSDGIIVELAPGAGAQARRDIAERLDATHVRSLGGSGLYLFERDDRVTRASAARALTGVSAVEGVSLDLPVTAAGTPNDPCFSGLAACPIAGGQQQDMRVINLPAALDRVSAREPVTVAVIDTSVGLDHPDLQGRLWSNPGESGIDAQGRDRRSNGVDDDVNGFIDDIHGADWVSDDGDPNDTTGQGQHGTHVAGTIGAVTGNGIGIAGIAPGARIMSLRFLADTSGGSTSDAILAINYAVAKGARVINNSWVGWSTTRGYHGVCTAIRAALNAGVVVVSAAGNDGVDVEGGKLFGSTRYWPIPANCYDSDASGSAPGTRAANGNGQLTVAATDNSDAMTQFSNWGSEGSVDLAAPGYQVLSTVTNVSNLGQRQNSYSYMSGTSMASPHVAGAAALLLGERPALTAAAVRQAIIAGAAAAPATSGKTASGARLDLTGMLTQAGVSSPDSTPPTMGALQAPADGLVTRQTGVGLHWEAAQDASPVTYDVFLNGARIATNVASSPASVTLTEGRHTWHVVAIDSSGNSATSTSRSLTVDLTSPSVSTAVAPGDGAREITSPTRLQWTPASDALSTVAAYDVFLDGRLIQTTPGSTTSIVIPAVPAGGHTWSIVARDQAGNERASGPWAFTVLTSPVVMPTPAPAPLPAPGPAPVPAPSAPWTPGAGEPGDEGGAGADGGFSVTLNAGARATRSRALIVNLDLPPGAARVRWAEDEEALAGAPWSPAAAGMVVMLTPGRKGRESLRTVHLEVADDNGVVIDATSNEIVLDLRPPRGVVRRLGDGRWRVRATDSSGSWRFQARGGKWRIAPVRGATIRPPAGADAVRFKDALGNTGPWISPR